jgi:hypothetical protein
LQLDNITGDDSKLLVMIQKPALTFLYLIPIQQVLLPQLSKQRQWRLAERGYRQRRTMLRDLAIPYRRRTSF